MSQHYSQMLSIAFKQVYISCPSDDHCFCHCCLILKHFVYCHICEKLLRVFWYIYVSKKKIGQQICSDSSILNTISIGHSIFYLKHWFFIFTDNLELKKLVYLYLINYAKTQPDLALMAVNTFVKDANDPVCCGVMYIYTYVYCCIAGVFIIIFLATSTPKYIYTFTHRNTYIHKHTFTHRNTRTHIRAYSYIHKHSYTHTLTYTPHRIPWYVL